MSKKLNQWLDEFIENGADASDVTNWPENAGGGDSGEIIAPDGVASYYKIDVDELLRLVENREEEIEDNSFYSFGDKCERDGSGNEQVDQCVNLQKEYNSSDSAIYINGNVVATIARSSFSSWYDFINDNRISIEQSDIYLNEYALFVGAIRDDEFKVVETFDISKLLKKVE